MKRYRIMPRDFDVRANWLTMDIDESWESEIKAGHLASRESIRQELLADFGTNYAGIKEKNFVDIGPTSFSVLAYHNHFYAQARNAFVVCAYYPALTGVCSLGERILNHLIIDLRDSYKETQQYEDVKHLKSTQNWELMIKVLCSWGVLLPEVSAAFTDLKKARNRAIHFNPETALNDRSMALDAIHLMDQIIRLQFGAFVGQPWFIPNETASEYIAKHAENLPFVRHVLLNASNSFYVGPKHVLEYGDQGWIAHDVEYEDREITDEEYIELVEVATKERFALTN